MFPHPFLMQKDIQIYFLFAQCYWLSYAPQNPYVEVLTPAPQDVTVFRGNQGKTRSYGWARVPYD